MPELTAARVAALTGGRLVGDDAAASAISDDSREVVAGTAFAAIRGGHGHIPEAIASGAPFVIAEHPDALPAGASAVVVPDTVAALGRLAAATRDTLDVPVVAITGSTGKTMTRDLVAAALATRYRVHRTPRNYNAEIGVPITILATPDDAQALVVELGARHVGEIADLCALVRPTTGILTGIGTAHIEEFGTRETIARTKSELLASLPSGGTAIVPADDDFLDVFVSSTGAGMMTVGPGGAVRYRAERIDERGHTLGTVTAGTDRVAVDLPVAGRALMRNAAFAIAAALAHDVDPHIAAGAIATAELTGWRMEVREIADWTVINDAYNANPTSVASALRAAREMAGERPVWAVLGPMAELGDATDTEHRRAGRLATVLGYEGVIVVGDDASAIAEGAGRAIRVSSLADAVDAIVGTVPSGAVVVVKASRVAGLERLVDELAVATQASKDRTR